MDQSEQKGRRLCVPWNKGKLVEQKSPLRLKEIWAIRIRLQLACGNLPYSILLSTASCGPVTW
jgi:hypothetical protein